MVDRASSFCQSCTLSAVSLFLVLNATIALIFFIYRLTSSSTEKPSSPLLQRVRSFDYGRLNLAQPEIKQIISRAGNSSTEKLNRAPSLQVRADPLKDSYLHQQDVNHSFHRENIEQEIRSRLTGEVAMARTEDWSSQRPEELAKCSQSGPELEKCSQSGPELEKCSQKDEDLAKCLQKGKALAKRLETEVLAKCSRSKTGEELVQNTRHSKPLGKTVSFGDTTVDAKAEDFINKVKQDLYLQRMKSMLRNGHS